MLTTSQDYQALGPDHHLHRVSNPARRTAQLLTHFTTSPEAILSLVSIHGSALRRTSRG